MRLKLILLALLAVLALQTIPAEAQTVSTIIYQTDFNTDPSLLLGPYGDDNYPYDELWANNCGVGSSGCVYSNGYSGNGNPVDTRWFARYDHFERTPTTELDTTWSACVVNYLEFDLYYVSENMAGYADESLLTFVTSEDTNASIAGPVTPDNYDFRYDVNLAELPDSAEGEFFHVQLLLDSTVVANSYLLSVQAAQQTHDGSSRTSENFHVSVDNLTVWCDYIPDDLIRPLALDQEHPLYQMFDRTYAETLDESNTRYSIVTYPTYSFSQNSFAYVHAAAPGSISIMRPVVPTTDCDNLELIHFASDLFTGSPEVCYIFIPEEAANNGYFDVPDDGNLVFRLDLFHVWYVVLDMGSTTISYLVSDADKYIEIGDTVNGGCVLGTTVQLLEPTPAELLAVGKQLEEHPETWGINITDYTTVMTLSDTGGIAPMARYDTALPPNELPLYDSLRKYATDDAPCGEDPQYANCLVNDPDFRTNDQWTTSGDVLFNDPGISLVNEESLVKQVLALDTATAYSLTVKLKGDGKIQLTIGETVQEFTITPGLGGDSTTITIPAAIHTPDLTEFYTVMVKNLLDTQLDIESVCVQVGDPDPPPASSCYFANPVFDVAPGGWTLSTNAVQRDGSIGLPDGESVSQEITLPAGDYTIQARIYVWYDGSGETRSLSATDTAGIEYEFPAAAGFTQLTGPGAVTDVPFQVFWDAAQNQLFSVQIFTADFTVASDTTGDFTLRAVVGSATDGVFGIGLDLACVKLTADSGGETDDTCSQIPLPVGENLSSWSVWGWHKFNGFFQCQLIPELKRIREGVLSLVRLTGWQIRYWKAAFFSVSAWSGSSLFPWLNGHFRNIAMGNVAIVYSQSQMGFWDFLGSFFSAGGTGLFDLVNNIIQQLIVPIVNAILGIINIGVFLLFDIILQVVNSAFYLFNQAISIVGQMFSIFYGLIASWNAATPVAVDGVPQCASNPQDFSFCIMLWVAEHTIFSGVGALWIPLIIAYGAAKTAFWSIREFRGALEKAGAVL